MKSLACLALLSGIPFAFALHPIEEEVAAAYRGGPGHSGYYHGALAGEAPAGSETVLFAATAPYPPDAESPQVAAALVALNAEDGSVLWRAELTGRPTAPFVVGGTVLVGSDADVAHAFDVASGAPRWTFQTKGGVFGQPVVCEDTVYFGGGSDHRLYAISLAEGKKIWSVAVGGEGIYSPVRVEGDSLYAFSATHHAAPVLYAFETTKGKRLWQKDKLEITPLTGPNGFELAAELLVAGVTPDRYRKASDRTDDGEPTSYLVAFERDGGKEAWRVKTGALSAYAPATAEGVVVCTARTQESSAFPGKAKLHLLAWAIEGGEPRWQVEVGDLPMRWAATSPTIVDGLVYVASATKVFAYDLETGAETWQLAARDAVFAVAGKRCYVAAAGGQLVAVEAKTGTPRWRAELRPASSSASTPGPPCPGEIAPLAVAD